MIEIFYIGDNSYYKNVVNQIIRKLDFLYEEEFAINYISNNSSINNDLLDKDINKIFIIEAKYYETLKLIRKYDLISEVILLKDNRILLDKCYKFLKKIYTMIDIENINLLELDLNDLVNSITTSKSLKYKNRDYNLNIQYDNILYIYRDTVDRKIVIVTDNNTYNLNISLKKVLDFLDNRFKQVHRACVVNTNRVEMYNWCDNNIILDNGKKINMLSKKYF